jgi:hypothetical protein
MKEEEKKEGEREPIVLFFSLIVFYSKASMHFA